MKNINSMILKCRKSMLKKTIKKGTRVMDITACELIQENSLILGIRISQHIMDPIMVNCGWRNNRSSTLFR